MAKMSPNANHRGTLGSRRTGRKSDGGSGIGKPGLPTWSECGNDSLRPPGIQTPRYIRRGWFRFFVRFPDRPGALDSHNIGHLKFVISARKPVSVPSSASAGPSRSRARRIWLRDFLLGLYIPTFVHPKLMQRRDFMMGSVMYHPSSSYTMPLATSRATHASGFAVNSSFVN